MHTYIDIYIYIIYTHTHTHTHKHTHTYTHIHIHIHTYILAGTAKAVAKGGSKLVGAAAGAAVGKESIPLIEP